MIRHWISIVLLSVLTIGLTGCGPQELDRDLAGELIKAHYQYPNVETVRITQGPSGFDTPSKYQTLVNQGLIRFGSPTSFLDRYETMGTAFRYLEFTSTGNVFSASGFPNRRKDEVVGAIRDFQEVTGIRFFNDEKSEAEVEFTAIRTEVTPFGSFKGLQEGEIQSYSLKMTRYDDGWRVTSKKDLENLRPEQFPGLIKSNTIPNTTTFEEGPPQSQSGGEKLDIGVGIDNMNDVYGKPSDPESEVLKIRKEYQRINSTRLRKETYNWSAPGCGDGQIRYDFEGDRIVRVVVTGSIGDSFWTDEYYYYGDGTFFFSYEVSSYDSPSGGAGGNQVRTYLHQNYIFRKLQGAEKKDITPHGLVVSRGVGKPYKLIESYQTKEIANAVCME